MADVACPAYARGVLGACRHCGLPRDHANHAVVTGDEIYAPRHAIQAVLATVRAPTTGQSNAELDARSVAQPEPEPVQEQEPAAETLPESAVEPEPEPEPEPQPQPQSQLELEPEPQSQSQSQPEPELVQEQEPAAETLPESAVEPEPEPQIEPEPEPKQEELLVQRLLPTQGSPVVLHYRTSQTAKRW
jgi:outer membrane biosynthesis protein TonB